MGATGWAAFHYREFRLFCAARFAMALATQIQTVAVAWLVYDASQSALSLGLVGLASFLPTIALVLVSGLVADRYSRRWILIIVAGTMMVSSLGILAQVQAGVPKLSIIYGLLVALGAARAFGKPTFQAIVPNLVPKEDLANAIAWNSSVMQIATISGPAIGGILYAIDPTAPFIGSAGCFGLAALLMAVLRLRPAATKREPVTWSRVIAGLVFLRAKPVLLGAISLDLFAVLLGGATALMPIFARDVFHVGPWGLGLLRSMPAVGAVLMAVVLAHSSLLARHAGLRMLQAVGIFGLATIGFGLSTSFGLTLVFLAILGAADMVSVVVRQTLVQAETPDDLRGRVAAVNTVFIGASNELGEFESGTLAWLIGPAPAVVVGGVGTVLLAVCWRFWFPELARRDTLVRDELADHRKSAA
ncbi:MFS transporter [Microvirga rosea]|uniref:MFS transporter n=1 Tax=Microvirga rosea TaxID=2715425 RepID=UPI001D0A2850|nr:MFS transporter [Microvirga rosea]MCB8823294.1 MFS transporter [Microvirga rosea]